MRTETTMTRVPVSSGDRERLPVTDREAGSLRRRAVSPVRPVRSARSAKLRESEVLP